MGSSGSSESGIYRQEQPRSKSYADERQEYRNYRRRSELPQDSTPMAYPAASSYPRRPPPPGYPPAGYSRSRRQPADFTPAGQPSVSSSRTHPPPTQQASSFAGGKRAKLEHRYSRIADEYTSLDQVTEALAQAGLESSNLIIGIDFTKSNEWTGKKSFQGRSLHYLGATQNPYEQAISIIGKTLATFDEDNLIPCFGFGDASTHDQDVFSFYPNGKPCNGLEDALERYREIVPHLRLSGPTSFAPIVEMAMTIVEQSGGQYHVLLIIADGQVTSSLDSGLGRLSPQEKKTVDAIVKASEFPLSIILVGVGDGPWDMMKEFDDYIPSRSFDNFQFVNFTAILLKNLPENKKETEFALAALMEIPSQYKATIKLGILGHLAATSPKKVTLPPPIGSSRTGSLNPNALKSSVSYSKYRTTQAETSSPITTSRETQVCPVCLTNPRNMAFGCGHQTCCDCALNLLICPICRSPIETRIKLY